MQNNFKWENRMLAISTDDARQFLFQLALDKAKEISQIGNSEIKKEIESYIDYYKLEYPLYPQVIDWAMYINIAKKQENTINSYEDSEDFYMES